MALVILDRDGVINEDSDDYIKSPEEWIPIPRSLEAIRMLNEHQHTVVIATNQAGVARGLYTQQTLHFIHQKMFAALRDHQAHIHAIWMCTHLPKDQCPCRKPEPGMILQAKNKFFPKDNTIYMIGDSDKDLQAAIAAQVIPILVMTGNGLETQNNFKHADHVTQTKNLYDAVHLICTNPNDILRDCLR